MANYRHRPSRRFSISCSITVKIFVCPYFTAEDSPAHMALLVVDRPYFHKNTYSARYEAVTLRGSWTTGIPLLGALFREIARDDTLYHPDAYVWFTAEFSVAWPDPSALEIRDPGQA